VLPKTMVHKYGSWWNVGVAQTDAPGFATVAGGDGGEVHRHQAALQLAGFRLAVALDAARRETVSTLIDIKVLPKTMVHKYGSWWNVGVAP
jgi:3D-(3,5/4)-trihydroxycyclohexane-1,2-dione acylhydrolase (decyclizing)